MCPSCPPYCRMTVLACKAVKPCPPRGIGKTDGDRTRTHFGVMAWTKLRHWDDESYQKGEDIIINSLKESTLVIMPF